MSSRFHLVLALLFLAMGLPSLRAGTWEDANTAFAAGEYAKALPLYQNVIDHEGPNAARLFNLGNTYAKLNQTGSALLCFERAALLAPRDPDIQANLKLTRPSSAVPGPDSPPWWKAPLYWLSLHEWSWVTAAGVILIVLPALGWGFSCFPRSWWPRTAAPMLSTGLAVVALGSLALSQRRSETLPGIVIAPEAILRLSPFKEANAVGPLVPGQRVIPTETRDGWAYLTVPGSTLRGWLPQSEFAALVPRP
jgi:tetratricopeptide (TPR) repeat protein